MKFILCHLLSGGYSGKFSQRQNAKVNFLGITWESKRSWRVHSQAFIKESKIKNVHNLHCVLSYLLGGLERMCYLTLGWKFLTKQSFTPGPEIPQNCFTSLGNSKIKSQTPANSTRFCLDQPWKLHMLFPYVPKLLPTLKIPRPYD